MKRGEIRILHGRVTGRDQHAVIVGNDALNDSGATGWVITAPVDTSGASPDILVTVPITGPVTGMIRLDKITSVSKDRIGELAGQVDPAQMDEVAMALRAAFDI